MSDKKNANAKPSSSKQVTLQLPVIAIEKGKNEVADSSLRSSTVQIVASSVPAPVNTGNAIVSLVQGPLSPRRKLTGEMLLASLNEAVNSKNTAGVYKSMRSDCKPLLPFDQQSVLSPGAPPDSGVFSEAGLANQQKSNSSPSLLTADGQPDQQQTGNSGVHRRKKKSAGSAVIRRHHAPVSSLILQHSQSDSKPVSSLTSDPLSSSAATSTGQSTSSASTVSSASAASSRRGPSLRSPRSPRTSAVSSTAQSGGSTSHHGRRRSRASSMSAATGPAVDLKAMIAEVANESGGDSFLLLLGQAGGAETGTGNAKNATDTADQSTSSESLDERTVSTHRKEKHSRRK